MSQIETRWSLVDQAHRGSGDEVLSAQRELMERYRRAVHRYLLRVTRDPEKAADLAQEFVLRFLRGGFRGADPRRGRFRDFVKTSVIHLVIDAQRRERSRPASLGTATDEVAAPAQEQPDLDREFFECWRNELMDHAWDALAQHEAESGQPYYTVLRLRADRPDLRSNELAELLATRLSRALNGNWVRQTLLRARAQYVMFLIAEVTRSLGNPSPDQVDQELMNLDLWSYCKSARAPGDSSPSA